MRLITFLGLFLVSSFALAKPCFVIQHGFLASDGFHTSFMSPLTAQLRASGHFVYAGKTARVATVEEHVQMLDDELDQNLPAECTHLLLIGHSQGGLDSRAFAHLSKYKDRVRAVATVGTPHRGPLRDEKGDADEIKSTLQSLGQALPVIKPFIDKFIIVAEQMMSENMINVFNNEYPNLDHIDYISVGTASNLMAGARYPFVDTHRFATGSDNSSLNDMVVSVHSSLWGKALLADGSVVEVEDPKKIMGPFHLADHFSQMGRLMHGNALYYPASTVAEGLIAYLEQLISEKGLSDCEGLLKSS